MPGVDQTFVTGFQATGSTFPPGTHFKNATFEAPCTIAEGSILEDCTFVCLRRCGTFSKRCCPVFSTIGQGSISTGGTYEYVQAEASGRWSGVTDGPEGNVTAPDCRDCAAWGVRGVAVEVTGKYVVSGGLYRSFAEGCVDRCTDQGILILNDGDTPVSCTVGGFTVSG